MVLVHRPTPATCKTTDDYLQSSGSSVCCGIFSKFCCERYSNFQLDMSDKQSTTDDTRITAGALRMRASRRRRLEGLRCVTLDLRKNEIDRLIQLGHLRQADREDRNQVLLALYCFLDESALGDVHP